MTDITRLIGAMLQKLHGESDQDWGEIAEEYEVGCTPDHLRKMAQGLKLAEQAGLLGEDHVVAVQAADTDSEKRLRELLADIQRERVRLRDERTAHSTMLRNEARLDAKLDLMEEAVSRAGQIKFPVCKPLAPRGGRTLVVALGDVHYGATYDSIGGRYQSSVADIRMGQYASTVVDYLEVHPVENVIIVLLGDMISGSIHKEISITNRENVIEQVMGISELVSGFVARIAEFAPQVDVWSVSGNHSRLDRKEDSLHNERLDDLVTWYAAAALKHLPNVNVHRVTENEDTSIATFTAQGHLLCAVHGDYDKLDDASVGRLQGMLGARPDFIFTGHMHTAAYSLGETTILQNGSLCGSGDGFTVTRRLFGKARQCMYIFNKDGLEEIRPVTLID